MIDVNVMCVCVCGVDGVCCMSGVDDRCERDVCVCVV